MSDDDSKEHFVGFTIAELTVIACAIDAHQKTVDGIVGFRGATRFHTSVMSKIQTYCDGLNGTKRETAKAAYPPSCRRCNDRGVIETGNNDLPCECPAGDQQLFNTERGRETGAEIKARRR